MVFTTAGGGANQLDTGYEIDNSLRFQPNAYISRYDGVGDEPSNAGKIGTVSVWTKRGDLGREQGLFVVYEHNSVGYQTIWFNSDDNLQLRYEISGTEYQVKTNAKFRDPSAWYHVVAMTDTTQGTDSNRMKIYVNGTEQSYSSTAYPPQNATLLWGKGNSTNYQYHIGRKRGVGSTTYAHYNGYIAEVHLCMGQNYTASEFGETNDNGVWIPKEADVSYGTNGGYYEFKQTGTSADASGIGADTSGTGNHATVGGLAAIDVTVDTPTNNFATLNPLAVSRFSSGNAAVFAEGNLQIATQTSDNDRVFSVASMGVTSGKWYWEIKAVVASKCDTGVCDANTVLGYSQHFNNETSPPAISVNPAGNIYGKGGEDYDDHLDWAPDLVNNDIIMWALDMDNYELWHGINGTWSDSGDPTSGATGTGGIVNESGNAYRTNLNHGEPMFPFVQDASTGGQMKAEFNFGNPPFAISSGNSDANGYGNFEYAVPSGFYSLCTKNLAEYG
jgi:hypothetical protein